jgi:prevent-host-death family protein
MPILSVMRIVPNSVTVTSTEFKNRVGEFQDKALVAPVMITKNGREHTVLVSATEYRRLKRRDDQAPGIEEDIASGGG